MTDTVITPANYAVDGTGQKHLSLPKLNTLLLESTINWAIDSYNFSRHEQGEGAFTRRLKDGVPRWNQRLWGDFNVNMQNEENYCGTSFCIAGKALQDTGNLSFVGVEGSYISDPRVSDTVIGFNENYAPINGDDFERSGAAVLGLTSPEAGELFDGDNGIYQVVQIAREIAVSRGETLDLIEIYEPVPPAA